MVLTQLRLFTDGSCRGNPGPGGWAFLIQKLVKDDSPNPNSFKNQWNTFIRMCGYEKSTTNNRMELKAVIQGIKCIRNFDKNSYISVYSDSSYVVNGIHKVNLWLRYKWKINGQDRPNKDLWLELYNLKNEHKNIIFNWVRGHNKCIENEECDKAARKMSGL